MPVVVEAVVVAPLTQMVVLGAVVLGMDLAVVVQPVQLIPVVAEAVVVVLAVPGLGEQAVPV